MWDRKNQKGNQEFLSQLNDSISLDFEFVLALSIISNLSGYWLPY